MKNATLTVDHEGNQSNVVDVQLRDIQKKLPLRVLSEADWKYWTKWGHVIVPKAVPRENVERLRRLLWEFDEMDPDDPSTWNRTERRPHQMTELNGSGMVEIYNHQYLWDNRQYPRVYGAYVDIWDREDLWVTIDRANLNTPNSRVRHFAGFIHWDADTAAEPLPVNVQGVLALSDTDPEVGGFQCVPALFNTLEAWIARQPPDRDPFKPGKTGFETKFVPMKAGDLLIFNSLLAHGIRPNTSRDRARIAQYISMYPAGEGNAEVRERRIRLWRERDHPVGVAFPGDPREWEKRRYPRAALTALGERLLGLHSWKENSPPTS